MYLSELMAVGGLLPPAGLGLEVGVGSARFARPLGVSVGVDPSVKMARMSKRFGIRACRGVGESLPFRSEVFDFVLLVTTICFVDRLVDALREIYRVLKLDGCVVVGFVEKDSQLGRRYQSIARLNRFYREATFFTAEDVFACLREAGFADLEPRQTLFTAEPTTVQPVREGHGEGSFVAVRAIKRRSRVEGSC